MNKYLILTALTAAAQIARCASFTNSVSVDSFVRASAPASNYGGSGANAISGTNAANGSAVKNGAFDSFVRFNTFSMVTNFNALYGSNNWVITGATLQVTEQGSPANALFNRGKGSFEIRWIANDNWTEGTGTPPAPTTTGVVYNDEPTLLNPALDVSLGTFTNAGADAVLFYTLPLQPSFVSDMQGGGEVGFFFTTTDPNIGFTFTGPPVLPCDQSAFFNSLCLAAAWHRISDAERFGPDSVLHQRRSGLNLRSPDKL